MSEGASTLGRRALVRALIAIGVGLPLSACREGEGWLDQSQVDPPAVGRVVVVGAGVAGMTVAYHLARLGVEVEVLEAAPRHGGRIAQDDTLTDFSVPLGGEWLHVGTEVLGALRSGLEDEVAVAAYRADDTYAEWDGAPLAPEEVGRLERPRDLRFVGRTWLDVFDEFVVPTIADRCRFGVEVVEIDHADDLVRLATADGETMTADQVVVTVPMRVLRDGALRFVPDLPAAHRDALDRAPIWTGLKAFLTFDERFWPTFVEFAADAGVDGQRLLYDAAHGQGSGDHVLGLFSVGAPAEPYRTALAEGRFAEHVLAELDGVFDGAASPRFRDLVVRDWGAEPFVGQAYLADDAPEDIAPTLGTPFSDRVWLAGCSYTREDDWSSVHTAIRSARAVVEDIVRTS